MHTELESVSINGWLKINKIQAAEQNYWNEQLDVSCSNDA